MSARPDPAALRPRRRPSTAPPPPRPRPSSPRGTARRAGSAARSHPGGTVPAGAAGCPGRERYSHRHHRLPPPRPQSRCRPPPPPLRAPAKPYRGPGRARRGRTKPMAGQRREGAGEEQGAPRNCCSRRRSLRGLIGPGRALPPCDRAGAQLGRVKWRRRAPPAARLPLPRALALAFLISYFFLFHPRRWALFKQQRPAERGADRAAPAALQAAGARGAMLPARSGSPPPALAPGAAGAA